MRLDVAELTKRLHAACSMQRACHSHHNRVSIATQLQHCKWIPTFSTAPTGAQSLSHRLIAQDSNVLHVAATPSTMSCYNRYLKVYLGGYDLGTLSPAACILPFHFPGQVGPQLLSGSNSTHSRPPRVQLQKDKKANFSMLVIFAKWPIAYILSLDY